MRNVSKLMALAIVVAFTTVSANGQDEKKDEVKLSADQVAALKKWGDPGKLKDDAFTQATQGQNRKVVATLILAKNAKSGTDIHLGAKSGHLGGSDGADVVAVREGGSGLALVSQRNVLWIAYDDTDGFQAPVKIDPVRNTDKAGKLLGWGYPPPTAHTGYMVVFPKK